MSRYWNPLLRSLSPYVPGEQPQHQRLVKLNTNENPYPPSPSVLAAIAAVGGDQLRRYPDPQSLQLREALAQREGLQAAQVFVGNGSDEVLAHVFQALLKHDQPLYFPLITYSFYPVWCELYGIDYRQLPLGDDYQIALEHFPAANGGIIIANPNAPTGVLTNLDDIAKLARRSRDSVLVVDEAYIDFGGESATALLAEHDNLLVVQTLSKSRSLAGLRVGVAYGSEELIEGLVRVKDSFNSYPLDVLAQSAVLASLADEEYFQDACNKVINNRDNLSNALTSMNFKVLPSAANFVFAQHSTVHAAHLYQQLRERGVIVRYFNKPGIDNFLRISIGTEQECELLLQELAEILADCA